MFHEFPLIFCLSCHMSSKFALSLRSYSDLALPEVYSKQLLAPLALGCGGAAALKLPGNILRGVISRLASRCS